MSAQEINSFIEELNEILRANGEPESDDAVDPDLLSALADYVEGIDPTDASVEKLRQCLQTASQRQHDSLEERMKTAGSRRSLKLLREEFRRE